MKIYRSHSPEETKKLGRDLARRYTRSRLEKNGKNALVFALEGDLGSGKTTFVQGFLRGLGVRRKTTSPTFIIMRRFGIKNKELRIKNIYHVDAYRIKNPRELLALGFRAILSDPKNIVLVEWGEKIHRILPKSAIRVKFSHGKKENERVLTGPVGML